jgi:hypothetical protein
MAKARGWGYVGEGFPEIELAPSAYGIHPSGGGGVSREFCDFSLVFFKRCHLYYVVLHIVKI